jgi:Emfourin
VKRMAATRVSWTLATLAVAAVASLGASSALADSAAPPSIESESVSNVTPTGATLEAEINLHEALVGVYYRFQLVTDPTDYASEILCPPTLQPGYSGCIGPQGSGALPIGFLPGNTLQPSATLRASLDLVSAGVTLQPGTTYHYRVLAAGAVQTEDTIEWEPPTVHGVDQTFTTPSASTTPSLLVGSSQAARNYSPAMTAPSVLGCGMVRHQVLVNYRRSGGLGGGNAHLIVTQGGNARLTTQSGTRRTSLSPKIRARLTQALRKAHFAHLNPIYEPAAPPPDAFTYTITHACRTVRAVDTAVPSRLRAVIGILDQIVTQLSS